MKGGWADKIVLYTNVHVYAKRFERIGLDYEGVSLCEFLPAF